MITIAKKLTCKEWLALVPLVEDISDELPDGFLMFGQWMRAKIRWGGKVYFVSGWSLEGCEVILTSKIGDEENNNG